MLALGIAPSGIAGKSHASGSLNLVSECVIKLVGREQHRTDHVAGAQAGAGRSPKGFNQFVQYGICLGREHDLAFDEADAWPVNGRGYCSIRSESETVCCWPVATSYANSEA